MLENIELKLKLTDNKQTYSLHHGRGGESYGVGHGAVLHPYRALWLVVWSMDHNDPGKMYTHSLDISEEVLQLLGEEEKTLRHIVELHNEDVRLYNEKIPTPHPETEVVEDFIKIPGDCNLLE